MSANNYISVEPSENGDTWEVWVRDADTGAGYPEKKALTREAAIDWAAENDYTEYGLEIAKPKTGQS